MSERKMMPVPGHVNVFEHSVLVQVGLEAATESYIAMCRSPRGQLQCGCGLYDLFWHPAPTDPLE